MNIKIHSAELNRMMKTIVQCIDTKDIGKKSNIEIIHDNNLLAIRGTNGHFSAVMYTPLLGGTAESFCVDGTMFARVCSMCNGEISIITDGKTCTIKGAGRTKLPIVNADVPAFSRVSGKTAVVNADEFSRAFGGVAYAISQDVGRIILTGVLTEATDGNLRMVTLDGFQMSMENIPCEGDDIKCVIPGMFMKLVSQSALSGEQIKFVTDGQRIEARTDGMVLNCGLLTGEFPDYDRIFPKEFATETLVNVSDLMSALKSGSVINGKQNLIKMEVGESAIKAMNNSEEAEYEADIHCDTHGDGLKIAFNLKYLMQTVGTISADEAVLKFNTSVSPCVIQPKDGNGIRLLLPVRVQG